MAESGDGSARVESSEERDDDEGCPEGGDLALVMLPEFMGEERKQGDRQKNAEKGQRPGQGKLGAVQIGRMSRLRPERGGE